jgi:hypothetical protein
MAGQFTVTYPLYGIHQGKVGEDAQLQGCTHPTTGTDLVFLFTELGHAEQFAKGFGSGQAVKVADSHADLKRVLARGKAEAVAFDPVLGANRQVQVNFMVMVADILK